MKRSIAIVLVLLSCQAAWAQKGKQERKVEHRVAVMDSVLDLSDEQEQQVRAIIMEYAPQIKALREAGAGKDSVKLLRAEIKAKMSEVLTEEQKAQWQEAKVNRKQKGPKVHAGKARHGKGDSATRAKRTEFKQHRLDFDASLTQEEQDLITKVKAELKALRESMPEAKDSLSKEERKQLHGKKMEVLLQLDPIVENHKVELEKIPFEEIGRKQTNGSAKKKGPKQANRKYYRFLLMKGSK
jgi:Spy/CpxP family protein refolding chaperone